MRGICFSLLAVTVSYFASNTVSGFVVSRNEQSFAPFASSTLDTSQRRHHAHKRPTSLATSLRASSISPGDTVVVVGGTGGVGQLVTKKLSNLNDYKVRVTSRDKARGEETIDDDAVEVVEVDLLNDDTSALKAAVNGASAVVVSVGTTAFPTKKWSGGNTPNAVDKVAVTNIAKAAQETPGMKRVVLLTSVGVDRTKEMPFLILNLFGVLDAKKSGEEAIMAAADAGGFEYAIVRPGRLVGGPYTNLDLAKLMQIEGGAENGVTVEAGDTLLGDCKRDATAEAVVRCLTTPSCKNVAFSIISNEESALTAEQWSSEFSKMSQ